MSDEVKNNSNLYIKLIELIIQNVKETDTLKRIYLYAQKILYDNEMSDPGG